MPVAGKDFQYPPSSYPPALHQGLVPSAYPTGGEGVPDPSSSIHMGGMGAEGKKGRKRYKGGHKGGHGHGHGIFGGAPGYGGGHGHGGYYGHGKGHGKGRRKGYGKRRGKK